ncbi:bifunctional pyr operon transcriptional regulator/uracil phosphoribosyltransferase PyrR [Tundrisphaera lichenicola]|uniref:bifunctional pyr operon transcriptional regulator/uracil phosphoribosyltransferase PyrR n=1 Tax=Tundrisphaera lichenicola TaxID=2029860 RepID=UPI003EBA2602
MGPSEVIICDAAGLEAAIDSLAGRVAEGLQPGVPLRLVGVRSRGVPIAERIAEKLGAILGQPVPVGALDITLYRDDLDGGNRWPVLLGTEIPFPVDGAEIVLVDDVLYTGRTVRAALNAVCDLGRPARVRLVALVDRGHRELPIRADVVGLQIETKRSETVRVRVRPVDPVDEIVRISPPSNSEPIR